MAAWDDFIAASAANPCPNPLDVGPTGEGLEKQQALEQKYFSPELLAKYTGQGESVDPPRGPNFLV
jgi:hypothetical protein